MSATASVLESMSVFVWANVLTLAFKISQCGYDLEKILLHLNSNKSKINNSTFRQTKSECLTGIIFFSTKNNDKLCNLLESLCLVIV